MSSNINYNKRVLNFGAGPAKLPLEVSLTDLFFEFFVLRIIRKPQTLRNFFDNVLKMLIIIYLFYFRYVPDNYKILLMQGGGTGAFASVALNLMGRSGKADYLVTGIWSGKASKEAAKFGKVNLVAPKSTKPGTAPHPSTWKLDPEASYFYYCHNETVDGITIQNIRQTGNVPIVCDMSSSLMTQRVDISKYGIIFGGTQKNLGPSGVTIVIVREDLMGNPLPCCPTILDYGHVSDMNSIHNTPTTFSVYVMEKVLQWVKKNGGVEEMERRAIAKSQLLYNTIHNSNKFYSSPVDEEIRSRINIPFRVGGPNGDEKLEKLFLQGAEKLEMYQLKGHRLVGGMRASLYNAVTYEEVELLVNYMNAFQKQHSL
ncbi:probable phosphoserine aminotransferase [Agrilus planipennis]|uniref:phosphoserine transaminase n=1 Tax=Agrilus planipennis TaxID=224129 RepID=A0A7F5QZR3_AGRPL|nr:probable phosphoserine aminotransferase [Agrilus planipennis]